MPKSTRSLAPDKPSKAVVTPVVSKPAKPKFPLTPHPTGRWCKKIGGRLYYFGPIRGDEDGLAAVSRLERELPYLLKGEVPPPVDAGDYVSVMDLCNEFLSAKKQSMDDGELSPHSYAKYYETCELLIDHLGKHRRVDDLRPANFAALRSSLAKGCSIVTLHSRINRIKVVFNYASEERLISRPVYFGQSFKRPSDKLMRRARNAAGPRMFEADEIRHILDVLDGKPVKVEGEDEPVKLAPKPVLRAMVLLGINGGLGNTDVANLPRSAIDWSGWLNYPRPKTEIRRRIPLWPETVEALRKAIALRPEPKSADDADLVFITIQGNRFVRVQESKTSENRHCTINAVSRSFDPLLKRLHINGRKGLGFYCLRHTFETVGGECKDQIAVDHLMGHVDQTMAAAYRERISDSRLRAVTDTVRWWLFPSKPQAG